ncbi:hypothetical protein BpHYR1_006584 [Brachionus plicatilis]|uniref:Uncharacterized protein n=1 Tax=Brachionus plicatilis TaxID=10195 RepID=A0A3M7PHS1_BRAPC|nr:hypothetical protein BpHYR1_006584 [Brachionus plicatilis]
MSEMGLINLANFSYNLRKFSINSVDKQRSEHYKEFYSFIPGSFPLAVSDLFNLRTLNNLEIFQALFQKIFQIAFVKNEAFPPDLSKSH